MIRSFAARVCAPAALLAFVAGAPAMAAGQGAQIVDIKAPTASSPRRRTMPASGRGRASCSSTPAIATDRPGRVAPMPRAAGSTCSPSISVDSARAAARAPRTRAAAGDDHRHLARRRRRGVRVADVAAGRRQIADRSRRRKLRRQPVGAARPTPSRSQDRRVVERRSHSRAAASSCATRRGCRSSRRRATATAARSGR